MTNFDKLYMSSICLTCVSILFLASVVIGFSADPNSAALKWVIGGGVTGLVVGLIGVLGCAVYDECCHLPRSKPVDTTTLLPSKEWVGTSSHLKAVQIYSYTSSTSSTPSSTPASPKYH